MYIIITYIITTQNVFVEDSLWRSHTIWSVAMVGTAVLLLLDVLSPLCASAFHRCHMIRCMHSIQTRHPTGSLGTLYISEMKIQFL